MKKKIKLFVAAVMMALCPLIVSAEESATTFDLTVTNADGGATFLSHKGATKITFTNADKKVTMKVHSGKQDANPVTKTLEHLVKYNLGFSAVTISGGSGTPEGGGGTIWAGAKGLGKLQSSSMTPLSESVQQLTGPALVFEGPNAVYSLGSDAITLQYVDGKYVVNESAVEGTVTGVYFYDPAQNGFCQHGQCESAPLVTAQNYASLGLTSAYVGYYAVQNYGQLYWLSQKSKTYPYVEASVVLTADIVYDNALEWDYYIKMSDDKVFDGNGHSIQGIVSSGCGVFHAISSGCTVKNLGIKSITVSSSYDLLGGLCTTNSGSIINCYVDGANITVNKQSSPEKISVGALCAENDGEIKNCYAKNTKLKASSATYQYTGAICGVNNNYISNCHASGSVCHMYAGPVYCCKDYVSDERFASGEIAWLLNGSVNNGAWTAGPVDGTQVWYQNLSEGGDGSPVLKSTGSNTVYYAYKNCIDKGYLNVNTPLAHKPEAITGVNATCTTEGSSTYYECQICHQYFKEQACTNVTTGAEIIPALGHNYANGTCTRCYKLEPLCTNGKVYASVQQNNVKIDKLGTAAYNLTEGTTTTLDFGEYGVMATLKSGTTTVAELPMTDGAQLVIEFNTTVPEADLNKVSKTVTKAGVATIFSPFQLKVPDNSNVEVYAPEYDLSRNVLKCTSDYKMASGTILPVSTALFLKNQGDIDFQISQEAPSCSVSYLSLSGTAVEIPVSGIVPSELTNQYVVCTLGKGAASQQYGFYKYGGTTLAAASGFLVAEKPQIYEARAISIMFDDDDEVTGVSLTPALSRREGAGKYLERGQVVIVRNGMKYNVNGQMLK